MLIDRIRSFRLRWRHGQWIRFGSDLCHGRQGGIGDGVGRMDAQRGYCGLEPVEQW